MNDKTKAETTAAEPTLGPVTETVGPQLDMTVFPIYAVTVERSTNHRIVAEVPEYEIPVLESLHGEYQVTKGDHIYDDERPSDAAEILEALKRKYNNPVTGDVVTPVYRNAEELAKAAGIKAGKATRRAESVQVDNRKKK